MSHHPCEDTLRLGNVPEAPQLLRGGAQIGSRCPVRSGDLPRTPSPGSLCPEPLGYCPAVPTCARTRVGYNEARMEGEAGGGGPEWGSPCFPWAAWAFPAPAFSWNRGKQFIRTSLRWEKKADRVSGPQELGNTPPVGRLAIRTATTASPFDKPLLAAPLGQCCQGADRGMGWGAC